MILARKAEKRESVDNDWTWAGGGRIGLPVMMMADSSPTRFSGKVNGQFLRARWRL